MDVGITVSRNRNTAPLEKGVPCVTVSGNFVMTPAHANLCYLTISAYIFFFFFSTFFPNSSSASTRNTIFVQKSSAQKKI